MTSIAILMPLLVVPAAGGVSSPAVSFEPFFQMKVGERDDPEDVAVADINGDGRTDALLTTGAYADDPSKLKLFVFVQMADGRLAAPWSRSIGGGWPGDEMTIDDGDLDGNGETDVVVATQEGVEIFYQQDGALGERTVIPPESAKKVVVADMNRDDRLDIVVTAHYPGEVSVLLNLPSGFTRVPVADYWVRSLAVGDLTGDGRLDIVAPEYTIFRQTSSGSYEALFVEDPTDLDANAFTLADVTGDGRLDIVAATGGNRPRTALKVFEQSDAGTLLPPVIYPTYELPDSVAVADMSGDGRNDVVVHHATASAVGVYLGLPDGRLGPEELHYMPWDGGSTDQMLALGDVSGDGRVDILRSGGFTGGGLIVKRQMASRTTEALPETTITSGPSGTVGSTSATFTFSSSEPGSSFECAPDLWAFVPCTSPWRYDHFRPGWHHFYVHAVGEAGPDPTDASAEWYVAEGATTPPPPPPFVPQPSPPPRTPPSPRSPDPAPAPPEGGPPPPAPAPAPPAFPSPTESESPGPPPRRTEAVPSPQPEAPGRPKGDTTSRPSSQEIASHQRARVAAVARIASTLIRVSARSRIARLQLTCPRDAAALCRGRVTLQSRRLLASGRFALGAGASAAVKCRLRADALGLLRAKGKLRARAVVRSWGGRPVASRAVRVELARR